MNLSIVVTTRNDDHGGDLTRRTSMFIHTLAELAQRHRLTAELIIVEWNPPPDRPALVDDLAWPQKLAPLQVCIITVPPQYHAALEHSDELPLFQMIGKNVGIRRARGDWVLSTNPDLLYSDDLIHQLATTTWQPDHYYRATRHDLLGKQVPFYDLDHTLTFCAHNVGVVHHPPKRGPHTMACGDFTLLAREQWFALRGYPEYQLWSPHIDSLFLFMCEAAGLQEVVLPGAMYHPAHSESWASPDCPKHRPMLDLRWVLAQRKAMLQAGQPDITNSPDWGLGDVPLPERTVRSAAKRAKTIDPGMSMTICAVPRPFAGAHDARQRNAIQSWKCLRPAPEIILLGDEAGLAEVATEYGCRHLSDVAHSKHGTPLLDDVLYQAQGAASYDLICYVNADIILPPEFGPTLEAMNRRFEQFLMTGVRYDLDSTDLLDFTGNWWVRLWDKAQQDGTLYQLSGMDWFAFRRGLYAQVPPLIIGRTFWDNWLLSSVLDRGVPTIDASRFVPAVHQGASQRLDHGDPERLHNQDIYIRQRLKSPGDLTATTWLLTATGELIQRTPEWGRPVIAQPAQYIGTSAVIMAQVRAVYPHLDGALRKARKAVAHHKVEIWPEQAAVLYLLARQFNHYGSEFLEIGTAFGYSAAIMAVAAPHAHIITLEVDRDRQRLARRNLASFPNVGVTKRAAADLLEDYAGPHLDLIFIDGNQKNVAQDLLWWNHLRFGGLLLIHDYTPESAPVRPCRQVFEAVHQFATVRGRDPDVVQMDQQGVGMAGWYRRDNEPDWDGEWR